MAEHYFAFLHTHTLFWFITLILFALTVTFLRVGKAKLSKIMQMTLRLFYVLVLITGIVLIFIHMSLLAVIKGILAFWLIYVMEMITNRMAKGTLEGNSKWLFWIQFVVAVFVVLYFGYFVIG
ncbi:YisL family protein [Bacillus shivajii]|uniref:YisL family protein n=1 Tax=Bacillus shivajii TaxID=1983719 RepID=UPI001CF987AB|nr:YisL family protein [Bacillus shivajii]UCZ52077.1 YisL family protein [Bacillus shivajii]